jgi:hypothetical protein
MGEVLEIDRDNGVVREFMGLLESAVKIEAEESGESEEGSEESSEASSEESSSEGSSTEDEERLDAN